MKRLSLFAGILLLLAGTGLGQDPDPARAFLDDPEKQERVEAIRADMKKCLDAGPELDAEAVARLEALEDVPFGVFEVLVRALGGGRDTKTGAFELPFTVACDGVETHMVVFVPEDYDPARKWPLLVTMHGHAGLCRQMLRWYQPWARKHGFLVVAPQAHTEYASVGWASVEPERSNPLSALEEMKRRYNVDPDRVTLGGCCMGGHGTWEVGMLFADRFKALFPTIGGPRLINFAFVENLLNLPMYTYVGLHDQEPLVWNIHRAVEMLEKIGASVRCKDYPDKGHEVVPAEDDPFFAWAKDRVRNVYPKKVVWHVCRPEHARAYWLKIDAFHGTPFDPYFNKKVSLKRKPRNDAEFRNLYIKMIRNKTPGFTADVLGGNRIRVRCRGLDRITLYLSDRLVDLDKRVIVTVNAKTRYREVPGRSIRFLLRHVAETNDTGRVFATSITLDAR